MCQRSTKTLPSFASPRGSTWQVHHHISVTLLTEINVNMGEKAGDGADESDLIVTYFTDLSYDTTCKTTNWCCGWYNSMRLLPENHHTLTEQMKTHFCGTDLSGSLYQHRDTQVYTKIMLRMLHTACCGSVVSLPWAMSRKVRCILLCQETFWGIVFCVSIILISISERLSLGFSEILISGEHILTAVLTFWIFSEFFVQN